MMAPTILRDWAQALDPARFAEACGFPPDDWQAEVLRSRAQRVLLNCSRQSGKSTTCGLLALHQALYTPDSLILMLSQTERQSGELFRRSLDAYRRLGRPIDAESESALQLRLDNGSRIIALPGKEGNIRAYSGVRLLLIDEAARVQDEAFYSVLPMLAVSQGRLLALSTPFGSRGWWYEIWRGHDGYDANGPLYRGDEWARWRIPAEDCPRIPADFLEEQARVMGQWWFTQEYRCRFQDARTAAFRAEDIARAFSESYQTWNLGV